MASVATHIPFLRVDSKPFLALPKLLLDEETSTLFESFLSYRLLSLFLVMLELALITES